MKKFLTKYWKNILIIIASIFIFINVVAKCVDPHSLTKEVAENAPDVESSWSGSMDLPSISFDINSGDTVNTNSLGESILSGEMMRIGIIIAVALIGVSLISDFANKKKDGKKKK